MFFSVRDLEIRPRQFEVVIPEGDINYLDAKLRQAGPLNARGKVELASETLREIRVRGHVTANMEAECDRCLEKSSFPVDADLDLYYRPADLDFGDEKSLDESEAEMGFYEGEGLELKDVLREFVLLTLPMQRLCREDCKGLCPVCGQSRNLRDCQCQVKPVDDRWAALQRIGRDRGH